jgi:hypothetical protein
MSTSVGASAEAGAKKSIADIKAVDKASADADDVEIFTKFIKKAEEVGQAAI